MKISKAKFDLAIARSGKMREEYRDAISDGTLVNIRRGREIRPSTVGRIARALGCDPADIIEEES